MQTIHLNGLLVLLVVHHTQAAHHQSKLPAQHYQACQKVDTPMNAHGLLHSSSDLPNPHDISTHSQETSTQMLESEMLLTSLQA